MKNRLKTVFFNLNGYEIEALLISEYEGEYQVRIFAENVYFVDEVWAERKFKIEGRKV